MMANTWARKVPETGNEQELVLVETEPGIVQLTTEAVEGLLEQGGWEPAP